MPEWVRWFNGWSVWIIAALLVVALILLLRTFKVYLTGKMMKKETKTLRTFLILFTLGYLYLAFIVVVAYIKRWDLSANPVTWPIPV